MKEKRREILIIFFATFLHFSYGCQMENVVLWPLPVSETILDTFRGTIISRGTSDIEAIINVNYGESTMAGPYFDVELVDSQFTIRTNNAFAQYEENEVASTVSLTVEFRCTTGPVSTNSLIFMISITDTNNNPPRFIPTNEIEFVVAPPLPPGFRLTGCYNDIIVRDIDLTTQRIEFAIEDNPYLEIDYDASASTEPKEFKAVLRTTTFIRSLPEPVTFTITATDVDLTEGPPLTTTATLRVVGDSEFQFPDEPKFGQTFYLASYTETHQLNLLETISLQQGFDEYVQFSLEGENANNFRLSNDGNRVLLEVETQLPSDIWSQGQIYLIVRAVREYTSGDTATVVVELPKEETLQFDRAYYEGAVINNALQLSELILSQGNERNTITAEVIGDHSSFFTPAVQGNVVTLSMIPLTDEIIDNNSFISIQVVARSERSEATTVVSLEIVKDDNVTPVFDKSIYSATYDPVTGLSAEPITFVQGFDDTVAVRLDGEHANLFQISQNGLIITLTSATIPPELFSLQNILISIEASKPRTVGANAVINIALPAARELEFEGSIYRGTIEDNQLTVQTILLSQGYEEGVTFVLSGEYATYFTVTNTENRVLISLLEPLPDIAITTNNVIMLTLTASGTNAITTSTSILLDIIKEDLNTPVFSRNIYYGTYAGAAIEIEAINLAQGYETGVTFRLDGAHAQYFTISTNGNNAVIELQFQIPEAVIFNEKVLVFNVLADKAFTVGANAAVLITFPTELTEDAAILGFDRVTYLGSIENGQSAIPVITLSEGFTSDVVFTLHGELSNYFSVTSQGAVVSVALQSVIPEESIPTNRIILLELQATATGAIPASATIVIEYVIDDDISTIVELIFAQTFYSGSYSAGTGLSFPIPLSLSQGYDSSVVFALEGDNAQWFGLTRNENSVSVILTSAIPAAVLTNNQQLVFVVTARRPDSATSRATVVISLIDELNEDSAILGFDRVTYLGSIENGQSAIPAITLSEGFTSDVVFTLHGELSNYFSVTSQGAVVSVALQSVIPEESIPTNRIILLELQATATGAIPASATIVIEYVIDDDISTIVELIFAQTFYSGSYSAGTGLSFPIPLSLSQGYDSSVVFALEGDNAQWFGLTRNENSVSVILTSAIPAAVLTNNQQLVFVVTARRPDSATSRATVVISLIDELNEDSAILGFDRVTYLGSIENGQSAIPAITLSEGFTSDVVFTLHGELSNYFSVTSQGAVVSVALQSVIPEESIPTNRIILLELQATATGAIPASATIVIEYVIDDDISTIVELIFAQTFYSGSYSAGTGLSFPIPLSLSQGYDSSVVFALEGDNAQWFGLTRNENSVSVILTSAIPAAVLTNNQQLVFVVTARRPDSATSRATVVISLIDELNEDSAILGFDRVTYLGSIENGQSAIPAITLSEGFTSDVVFTLHGELSNYFSVTSQGAVVSVALQSVIPEESIPTNRIILLELQATATGAIPASATIVIEYVIDDEISTIVELIFAQTFYSGSYSAGTGLSFPIPLSLSQGYDSSVVFALEGDNAQWFGLTRNENSVSVILTSAIPAAVLTNNQQLVFVVTARRPDSATSRATVVISLIDELNEDSAILGFDRVTYLGSIENGQSAIPAITLSEGFTSDVVFTLHGELSNYFSVTSQGAVVSVALQSVIPEESIPTNRIILLELQATATGAIPASATIVIEYVIDDDISTIVELIFAQTFYSGSYSAGTGLSFPIPLSLSQGYDSSVVFALEGDNAQWFGLTRNENSVSVILTSAIPAAVLTNNQQLVFVVTARRPDSATSRATVVISLIDELNEDSAILGFDRVTYLGSIENGQSAIPAITLSEGFTSDVVFTLHGELSNYFSVTSQGAVVSVALQSVIPEESIPTNRIILLELQATATGAIPASATIVIEYVIDDDISTIVELIFAQTFYSGSYSAGTGLSFPIPLSLSQGYDSSVVFALEGDNAQWFGLTRNENSVSVILTSAIPAAVLTNNQQLVFVVTARRPDSATSRATVVISLIDELNEDSAILGFDRVTYLGSIENGQSAIPAITLSEGFTSDVVFTLHGELSNYFSVTSQGAVVSVALQSVIPEESIPTNRIILLELQATATGAIPASATIVIEYVIDDDISTIVELIFAQTFYSGSYSAGTGLSFPIPLSLSQGYDSSVVFALEGDNAQWFGLTRNENSVSVILTSAIPAAVLTNNQQLVFVVTARRPDSATSRATVVISLIDELNEDSAILGFDRVTYLGSIENGQSAIPAITLSEGFTSDVVFTLHGELSNYFSVTSQGAVVSVALQSVIPEESIPTNRIILLELQATATGAIPASATIVIEYVIDDEISTIVELIFAQTFYSGSYSAGTGLSFPIPLSLSQGYDSSVVFALEGDNAQWFGLTRNENSVSVILTSAIPAAVLTNNQQLVFVVTARRPDSATSRTTVVISLIDELNEDSAILGFDRVTYLGSIENGQSAIPAITLSEGFTSDVVFKLHGELSNYFSVTSQGAVVSVALQSVIPEESIPTNRIILLELQATATGAIPASATIVIEYVIDDEISTIVELIFAQTFYSGSYSAGTGLSFPIPLSLSQGYDSSVVFALEGDNAQWFGLTRNENSVSVILTSAIPAAVLTNNQQLVFVVTARRPDSATSRATVVISLIDELNEDSAILGFDRVTYLGSIENGQSTIPAITLSEGFTSDVVFTLHGELSNYFSVTSQGAVVSVALQSVIPEESIPTNRIILLELQATATGAIPASATIVIEYVIDDDISTIVELIFAQTFYSGSYSAGTGLSFPIPLSLSQGYDSSVVFALEGDNAQWFGLTRNENSVSVILTSAIPAAVLTNNQQVVFVVTARRPDSATARATVIIDLEYESQAETDVAFEKVLFEGIIQYGVVSHEVISIIGFSGSNVELHGEYSTLFEAELSDNIVTVRKSGSIPIPANVNNVALELRAGPASAVLLLNVIHTEVPSPPTVTFSSPSYAVRVETTQTGLIGRVEASADNGEPINYALILNNAHLEERLSVNSEGDLHLFAPVDIGDYTIQVVATTVFTQTTGTATVQLTVEAVTECGGEYVVAPLIVLDVDEEEPHYNLIDVTQYDNCHFTLTNRWPSDQTWLYVDERGLHTRSIDREHESIAFMHVSQIQVEIVLHCNGDVTRTKRSIASDPLVPYDYGASKWILTDTILYNSRRSYVNIIVNDINDNAPIFVGKELEPIAVGYPVADLAETVLPRSLAELQATDADIGENAALVYWSSAVELAVSPNSGFVHVRDGAELRHGAVLSVHATDRLGEGLTGSIDLLVRLLDESHIAVVTIRDAFLDDEKSVLSYLSESVGYEVKVLRSVVISDGEASEEGSRKKRDVTGGAGASLQLYVYGLIEREPVDVDRLTSDISNIAIAPVIIASTVSLQDHLEAQEICVISGRDTGLLVATIVLSVLLFIVLVLIAVWFFLRWRRKKNYDQFSDENSLASRVEVVDVYPRPEILPKPRLDIAELKKSERRLQEMLDAPNQVITEPASSRNDAILDFSTPEPLAPIVIQSIDKLKDPADESSEDEFGETQRPKRKSVVTFNENVEKIIHVEDTDPEDISSNADLEIYKL